MKQIVIACDKFKGSISALEACNALKKGLKSMSKSFNIIVKSMADGGEGSLEILQRYRKLEMIKVETCDPLGRPLKAEYGIDKSGNVYIESFQTCGLMLLEPSERNPMNTNSQGLGLMIKDAISRNPKEVHIFLGGSATSDGGAGMMSALGVNFYDQDGNLFEPKGKDLLKIHKIDFPAQTFLHNIKFYAWCDVDVPLLGKNGAALLFAQQKGADRNEMLYLEKGLRHYSKLIEKLSGEEKYHIQKGSGAAGGLGFGIFSFLQGILGMGIDFFINISELEEDVLKADIVISGEGSFDNQSSKGKVVYGIKNLSKKLNKTFYVVCGKNSLPKSKGNIPGIKRIFSIVDEKVSLEDSMTNTRELLLKKGREIGEEILKGG